ncbi:MAG: prepilin-type N-terminal cleavage/methylation domain-containing protein [Planctomycetes bacterium]|nr:prepilin-type N-terminal cleavage/methylation domain-containing protein [Planctomycetota bacterium]
MKYHQAFTLMEVLASLVLLSLLVSTLIPLWSRIRLSQAQMVDSIDAQHILVELSIEDIDTIFHAGEISFQEIESNTDISSETTEQDKNASQEQLENQETRQEIQSHWVIRSEALQPTITTSDTSGNKNTADSDGENSDNTLPPGLQGQWLRLVIIDTHNDNEQEIASLLRYHLTGSQDETESDQQ